MITIHKNFSGFTLVEMLVVMSIIGIFSSFLVVNFRSQENQRQLKNGALALLDGIKKAQTLALSGSTLVSDAVDYGLLVNPAYNFVNGSKSCQLGCIYAQKADASVYFLEALDFPNVTLDNSAVNFAVGFSLARGNITMAKGSTVLSQFTIKLYHSKQPSLAPYCVNIATVSGRLEAILCP